MFVAKLIRIVLESNYNDAIISFVDEYQNKQLNYVTSLSST